MGLKEPHKIIISDGKKRIVLFCYDDKTNLYKEDLSEIITISKLIDIVKEILEKNKNF